MHHVRHSFAWGGAALLLLASPAGAIPPSNWTTITLPPNVVSGPDSIGTTVTFQTTTDVHFYSGVTKQWTVQPVTSAGPIFQANDYAVVQDGNLLHGYASHTGVVDTIAVASPVIVSGPASSSWVTLVADGTQAWGFSAFRGKWVPLTLSQPNPVMVSNRLIGMLRDGSTVYGFNAQHGTFVPVAADPLANLVVVGEAEIGTAHSPTVFRAFSTQQNTWSVQAVPSTASGLQQNEYALVVNGTSVFACSGITGTVATYNASGPITGLGGAEGVAAFRDGNDVVCYASGTGTFVSVTAPSATLSFDYNLVMVKDASGVTPFSGIRGAFGSAISGTFALTSNDCIAYADGASTDYAYSPILNQWTPAPAGSLAGSPVLVRNSVVLPRPNGYDALSARYGTWVFQSSGSPNSFNAPASGSTFLALDGLSVAHVFDARLNRWASLFGAGTLQLAISRHTVMGHDGTFGYGFGQPSGEWYSVPLTGASPIADVASSIGTIEDGGDLHIYSVKGALSHEGRFPEFTQAINLGNTLRLYQVAPAGSALVLMAGIAPTRIDLGALLGKLYIDPSVLITIAWPVLVGASGVLELDFPLPTGQPALVGLQPHLQTFVQPPGGVTPWLSSSVAPILY